MSYSLKTRIHSRHVLFVHYTVTGDWVAQKGGTIEDRKFKLNEYSLSRTLSIVVYLCNIDQLNTIQHHQSIYCLIGSSLIEAPDV